MTKALIEAVKLPHSTAECDEGPLIEGAPGRVVVRYDSESDSGAHWTSVRFSRVAGYRFTVDAAVETWMLEAYSRICELPDSEWLEALRRQAAKTGAPLSGARHYVLFFDHHGCLEVVAESFSVDG